MKYHGKFSLAAAGIGITLAALLFAVSPALAAVTSNILPTGDGYSLQWTPSTGTTHFTLVDETSCNGTTDYNFTATVGQRDAYAVDISSIPDGSTITAVAEKPCASRNSTGGGSATLDVFYRTNGVNSADAGSYALPTGTTPLDLATTTFSGLSSVKSSSTSFQVGAVYTAGTKGIRLSRLATQITYTTLNAPSGLTASSSVSSTTVVTLNWTDNATNETSNVIERGLSTSSFAQIGSVGSTTHTYTDTTASAGTTYYYRVRATNSGGNSAYSNTATATTGSLPSLPLSLGATTTGVSTIALGWVDTASNETGFKIERSTSSSFGFVLIGTTSVNVVTYNDSGLLSGTTYYYRVRATNGYGDSANSNVASATTGMLPAAPSGLSAVQNASLIELDLSWTDNSSNESGFVVERKLATDSTYASLATTSANVINYADTTVTQGATYNYRLRAYNTYGYSEYAASATGTAPSIPSAPTFLSVSATNTVDVFIITDTPAAATYYNIERSFNSTSSFALIATSTNNQNINLAPGSGTWWYRVSASNNYGTSGYSPMGSVTFP